MNTLPLAAEPPAEASPDVILVVDADPSVGHPLVSHLRLDGYQAILAQSANHARLLATQLPLAAVVLGDLETPRLSLDVLDEIRCASGAASPWDPAVPVLIVSPRTEELDLARAFEAGADDFMARPARYVELRARLRAVLRRVHPSDKRSRPLRVGPLEIDTSARKVSLGGTPIELRRLEYELLVLLASAPERVFSKEELLCSIWGYRSCAATRTVDSHASRLRRKLDGADAHPPGRWVINVWGVGYRLK
jgi:DNA-binding response OmpR family regulator